MGGEGLGITLPEAVGEEGRGGGGGGLRRLLRAIPPWIQLRSACYLFCGMSPRLPFSTPYLIHTFPAQHTISACPCTPRRPDQHHALHPQLLLNALDRQIPPMKKTAFRQRTQIL